jgi:hypothetical protein
MALRLPLLTIITLFLSHTSTSSAFSTPTPNSNDAVYTLFDRFRAICPADPSWVAQFDASLIDNVKDEASKAVWVAVYRSNNNKPSVLIKDSLLQAMKSATDSVSTSANASDPALLNSFEMSRGVTKEAAPVAVARLIPSEDFSNTWILDYMRCVLKKENTDASCDGGSEHTEALTIGIDTLVLHYLSSLNDVGQKPNRFEGAIRTKATLVSATLLEDRGFREIEKLTKDMATHISSLDVCLEQYAARAVDTVAKSPGAQQRALSILSHLGRIDRDADLSASQQQDEENDTDDYDPFASIMRYL